MQINRYYIINELLGENHNYEKNSLYEYNSHMTSYDCQNNNINFFDGNIIKENKLLSSSIEKNIEIQKFEERSTNIKSLDLPNFYSFDEIMKLFEKICSDNAIKNKLKEGKCIDESPRYNFMKTLDKKRRREEEKNELFFAIKTNNAKKPGRKTQNVQRKEHDKMASDNIIKKIKAKLFESILNFNNTLLSKMNLNINLVKIDYKFIDKIGRQNELQLLKTLLKDILSWNITRKYKHIEEKYNKYIIESIIESKATINKYNDFNYDTLMFVLNITFRDWLNVLTGKNNFESLANDYKGNQDKINFNIIKESFVGINDFLGDLVEESDDKYFAFFVFYLYNYERWFCIKSPRTKKKKEEEIK